MRKVILSSILIRIFISMMKHPDHKQVEKKGFIWLPLSHHSTSSKEVKIEIQIPMACLVFFLVEPRTTSSGRGSTIHNGLGSSPSISS